jgi:hypothetical protein
VCCFDEKWIQSMTALADLTGLQSIFEKSQAQLQSRKERCILSLFDAGA